MRKPNLTITSTFILAVIVVLFNNCGQGFKALQTSDLSSQSIPTPTVTPRSTPTPRPSPSPTPRPTTTPNPPTPTPVSPTPRPSPTPTAAPSPTPSPTAGQATVPFSTTTCPQYQHVSFSEVQVKNEHPRVFLTSARLNQLRSQYRSGALANNKYWVATLATGRSNARRSDESMATLLDQWSQIEWVTTSTILAAAVTEDAELIAGAKRMANYLRTAHGAGGTVPSPQDTYMVLSERAVSFVYDWLYDKLTAAERTTFRQDIEYRFQHRNARDYTLGGHDFSGHLGAMIATFAIYHDSSLARAHLQAVLPHVLDHYLPSYSYLIGCDGSTQMSGYARSYTDTLLEVISSLSTATNINMYQRFPNFQNSIFYYYYATRGDQKIFFEGDAFAYGTSEGIRRLYERIAKGYQNGFARTMWEQYEQLNGFSEAEAFQSILYDEPLPPARPIANMSKNKFFKSTGHLYVRSGWQQDSEAPQVAAMFKSTPNYFVNHVHRDMNHFSVYYRGEQLIDSGSYDAYPSAHWHNYYTRTIAHNSLLVFNPSEVFSLWGGNYSNDGGQQIGNPVTTEFSDLQNPAYNYGGIVLARDTTDYTYAIGRAEKAYAKVSVTGALSNKKLNFYARHFLFLKNVSGARHPVILIYDDLEKVAANLRSTFVLHTATNMAFSNRTMVSTNGNGRLQAHFLLPSSLQSEIVGGDGREYEINGVNYPPTKIVGGIPTGKYRLEISPSSAATKDKFLAVIYAGDPSGDPAPTASLVSTTADTATVRVGNYTIRFETDDVAVTRD